MSDSRVFIHVCQPTPPLDEKMKSFAASNTFETILYLLINCGNNS
jgi:hypothetical protein